MKGLNKSWEQEIYKGGTCTRNDVSLVVQPIVLQVEFL